MSWRERHVGDATVLTALDFPNALKNLQADISLAFSH